MGLLGHLLYNYTIHKEPVRSGVDSDVEYIETLGFGVLGLRGWGFRTLGV